MFVKCTLLLKEGFEMHSSLRLEKTFCPSEFLVLKSKIKPQIKYYLQSKYYSTPQTDASM